jgi:hypothetical protein
VVWKKQGNLDDHRLNDIELNSKYKFLGLSNIRETSGGAEKGWECQRRGLKMRSINWKKSFPN